MPAGSAVVVRVAGQLAMQASRGGYLGRLLEAAAFEALLTALLGAASRGRGLLGVAGCACLRRLRLRLLAAFAFFGSSRVAVSVLITGLSSG